MTEVVLGEPTLPPDQDNDLLAAEYVTGLLDLPGRVAVETRARNDAVFAARLTEWENRLADLNEDYAEAPAPNLMPQIEARLFPVAARQSLWSNLWVWGAAVMAALAVVVYLALTPVAPCFTATLANAAGTLRYEAVVTQDQLTITRVAGDGAEAGRVHELWIIVGDAPPVSLGVIAGASATIALPGVQAGGILAISVEPAGGSPTGSPTSAPVALGKLTAA